MSPSCCSDGCVGAQDCDNATTVPPAAGADLSLLSIADNGNVRIMLLYVCILPFLTEVRAAAEAAELDRYSMKAFVNRLIDEIDSLIFEQGTTMTYALEHVLARRFELDYARSSHGRSGGTRRPLRSPSTPSSDGSTSRKPKVKRARKSGGNAGRGASSGKDSKQLCFAWAQGQVDKSASGCSCSASKCKFRHKFANEAEKKKSEKRWG